MADPGQIYHNSGTPPLIYYMGKEYIGGTVSYERTIPVTTQGNSENSEDNIPENEE